MNAILLSAGFGSRLRPITDKIQKCLVPIGGKPLLEYWLKNLFDAGINRALVNTHYLPNPVNAFIRASKWTDKVDITFEDVLLGTGGTLLKNNCFYGDEAVMLIHADNFSLFDMREFIQAYKDRPACALMTMMTFTSDQPHLCGIVDIDDGGIVTEMYEKWDNPPGNIANGAVYILSPELIDMLLKEKPQPSDMSTQIIPTLMGKINTFHNNVYHRDIGNLQILEKANEDVVQLRLNYTF